MSKELEALEELKQLKEFILKYFKNGLDRRFIIGSFDIIEKKLKRLEELEKAFIALSKEDEKTKKLLSLEIEKNRVVDIIKAKLVDFNRLNRAEYNWEDDGKSSPVEYYNEGLVYYCQLTEEEYNFLVNMVGIR